VKQVPSNILNHGSVSCEDGLGIDNLEEKGNKISGPIY
jgi:hypothetical protein